MFKNKKEIYYVVLITILFIVLAEIFCRIVFYSIEGNKAFAVVGAAEKIKKKIYPTTISQINKSSQVTRYIRLKEYSPELISHWRPTFNQLEMSDGYLKDQNYSLRVDSNGFIEPSGLHDNPDLKIVFLGGSTTECFFIDENRRFPFLVGQIIEDKLRIPVNTYNAGVSGNNSMHSFNIFVNKVIPINPDMVVIMHNINDLSVLYNEGSYWNDNPTRSMIIDSRNLRKLDSNDEFAGGQVLNKEILKIKKDILRNFHNSLDSFVKVAKIWGIQPVLMTQANRIKKEPESVVLKYILKKLENSNNKYNDFYQLYYEMNNIIREVAENNKIKLIDLDRKGLNSKEFIYDSVHFNEKGSVAVAGIISEELIKIINKNDE